MAARSVQKQVKEEEDQGYCRKCKKTKKLKTNFYETTTPFLDANGYLSICKECVNDIYVHYFSIYSNMRDAVILTCQDLDVRFSEGVLEQTQSHVEKLLSKNKSANAVFGYYKSKLSSIGKMNENLDMFRFKDSDHIQDENVQDNQDNQDNENDVEDDLVMSWGRGFSYAQYLFLETELAKWKKTHKCDNQAEETLLREICIKISDIRTKRETNAGGISGDLKELQELMKTANVDPAKANAASAGKSHEAFGVYIKEIEQFRPAEWFEQQDKYQDTDGFIPYIQNYIVRPIKNFITGTRDFVISDNINANLDDIDDLGGDV